MWYKSIVNELDKFLIKRNGRCTSCPLKGLVIDKNCLSLASKLRIEFNIESKCIVNFFYKIKDVLPEDKINFLLKELKENNIQNVKCYDYKEGSSRFIKVLKSIIFDELEIE